MIGEYKDRQILTELHRDEKAVKIGFFLITILFVILIISVFYLTLRSFKSPSGESEVGQLPTPTLSAPVLSSPSPTSFSPPVTPTQTVPTSSNTSVEPAIKDYYIPFGTGTNQTSDWTDVPGMQAVIDFGNYTNIKEVYFEVNVNIPTGNEIVWVRLYNLTDKHPVWYSEVSTTNNDYVFSSPIVYDTGTKVYQVQMKTQLQYPANITLARVHIVLK